MKNLEGYWGDNASSVYPLPVRGKSAWSGQDTFLIALRRRQDLLNDRGAGCSHPGYGYCRYGRCLTMLPIGDYETAEWRWPRSYDHYVETHYVRPSLAFQQYLLGYELDDTKTGLPVNDPGQPAPKRGRSWIGRFLP